MSFKTVVIIDDEAPARLILRQYLEDHTDLQIVTECKNGVEAVTVIDEKEPDLVFLDIQMPLLNGFQVIQKIIHIPQIIFTTAFDKYALRAFDVNAIDYLLKPYTKERFDQAVQKAVFNSKQQRDSLLQLTDDLQKETAYPERLLLENQGRLIGLLANEILRVEASGEYSKLHTFTNKQYLSSSGISKLEQKLNPKMFIRIHRSEIINLAGVKEIQKDGNGGYNITLINNGKVRVSRGYADVIKDMVL